MTTHRGPHLVAILLSSTLLNAPIILGQGSLVPPGPPSPTMKKLDEVEPRTNLQATPAPTGVDASNASYHFIINQPGSYYLSANLSVTKTNGIQINVEGVTLDLNGFQISRTSGTGGSGIEITGTSHRASIHNGSIRGFTNGIQEAARGCAYRDLAVSECSAGILTGSGALIESCRAHDNVGLYGIYGGHSSRVSNCTATNNSVLFAILADNNSTLVGCSASDNTASYGILADIGSTITDCTASGNTSSASRSGGFAIGYGSTVSHCTSLGNTNTVPGSNTGMGFDVANQALFGQTGRGTTIQDCVATNNQGDGIRIFATSMVRGCTVSTNGRVGVSGANQDSVVDCNISSNNGHGIQLGDKGTITNSVVTDNGAAVVGSSSLGITAGNGLAVIHCVVSGNSAGGISSGAGSNIRDCTLYKNLGTGATISAVSVGDGSTVTDCTARENNGDGIRFNGGCRITDNTCDFNGLNTPGAGIHGTAGGSRIEGNTTTGNQNYGIQLDAAGNTVFKNSTRGNIPAAFNIVGGNDVGPTGTAATATSPFANIAH